VLGVVVEARYRGGKPVAVLVSSHDREAEAYTLRANGAWIRRGAPSGETGGQIHMAPAEDASGYPEPLRSQVGRLLESWGKTPPAGYDAMLPPNGSGSRRGGAGPRSIDRGPALPTPRGGGESPSHPSPRPRSR
jgi:hypothetical protein